MMNLSLIFLYCSFKENSPFLTNSKTMASSSFLFDNNFIRKSFSSFCFSQAKSNKYVFNNMKFYSFLSSPLIFNRENYVEQYYTDDSLVLERAEKIQINNSVFKTCVSSAFGGGIRYDGNVLDDSHLIISQCLFEKCIARLYGGAVYASCSRYSISESCFSGCLARSRQAALFRGESKYSHVFNLLSIYNNGRGKDDQMTLETSSNSVIITNINSTKNAIEKASSGLLIKSNFMLFMKFSTFCENTGSSVLNINLKNLQSSIEYNNIINNRKSSDPFESIISCSPKMVFAHFNFYNNSIPIIINKQTNSPVFFKLCEFDIPFNDQNFVGDIKHSDCQFEVKDVKTYEISKVPEHICIAAKNNMKQFYKSKNKFIGRFILIVSIGLWLIGTVFFVLMFAMRSFRQKGQKNIKDDEMIPFFSKKTNKFLD